MNIVESELGNNNMFDILRKVNRNIDKDSHTSDRSGSNLSEWAIVDLFSQAWSSLEVISDNSNNAW